MNRYVSAFRQRAVKSLGQHFLVDPSATADIVRRSGAGPDTAVLEIGPGPGVLTGPLLETGARVVVLEKDARAVAFLRGPFSALVGPDAAERLTVIEGDALRHDPAALMREAGVEQARLCAVGNLPYNVATGILKRFLETPPEGFARWTFMFQREVAQRLVAEPGSKAYGSLTLAVAARVEARMVRVLPPGAFAPPPKVDSAVVTFDPYAPARFPDATLAALERVARAAFAKRRKTIRNALKHAIGGTDMTVEQLDAALAQAQIDPRERAERVELDRFVALAQAWGGRGEAA